MARRVSKKFEYDLCLSFAGEDRVYVREVAKLLKERGVRVFFDEYAQLDMWGKDLYTHLDDIYQNAAKYCVLFISKRYAKKVWTNHERESAQARAIRQHGEYILPAKFDDTKIPGIRPTIGYINIKSVSSSDFADMIIKKLGDRPKEKYFPPVPDRLFKRLKARSNKSRLIAESRARDFFMSLSRMTIDEREVVFTLFMHHCPSELPDNVHIDMDLLRRLTGFAPSKIIRILKGISSLGFNSKIRSEKDSHGYLGMQKVVVMEWFNNSTEDDIGGNCTDVAKEMIECGAEGYCTECGLKMLRRLDFSQMATVTASKDKHAAA